MYHKDGIHVYLVARGNEIEECAYLSGQDPADTERNDTRATISAKLNTPFTIVLELTKDFRRFSAEGLKLTIAIGHNHQTPEDLDDVQAWHIPLDHTFDGGIWISKQLCWGGKSHEPLISDIRIPAPEAYKFDAVPKNDWIETYNAAKGCIAVYVVRGKLAGETDYERKTFATDPPDELRTRAKEKMYPIRWDWFHELRPSGSSRNGEPYIFEFRNVETEVGETTDPGPLLNNLQDDTEQAGSVKCDTHTTSGNDSDEDGGSENDSDENDSDENENENEVEDNYSDDSNDLDFDEFQDFNEFNFGRVKRVRAMPRYRKATYMPRHDKPRVKRRKVAHSESTSPSTERPERPSTEQPGPAVFTKASASNNTSAAVGGTATPTSTHPPNTTPGHPAPPITQNTPQPMPAGNSPLTPASEAGTSGSLHETHRERALAKRQLELSKAMNRASELEARNRINEIKQEIEFETKFGDVLGE